MTTNVSLTPELERFARACVDEGRYNNVSEVVRTALRLLKDAEMQRLALEEMRRSESYADASGVHDIDDVLADMDQIIEAA